MGGGPPQRMTVEQKTASTPIPTSEAWFDREVRWLRMDAQKAGWIAFAVFCTLLLYLVVVARFATGPIVVAFAGRLFIACG